MIVRGCVPLDNPTLNGCSPYQVSNFRWKFWEHHKASGSLLESRVWTPLTLSGQISKMIGLLCTWRRFFYFLWTIHNWDWPLWKIIWAVVRVHVSGKWRWIQLILRMLPLFLDIDRSPPYQTRQVWHNLFCRQLYVRAHWLACECQEGLIARTLQ